MPNIQKHCISSPEATSKMKAKNEMVEAIDKLEKSEFLPQALTTHEENFHDDLMI